jgi:hypothetical protein
MGIFSRLILPSRRTWGLVALAVWLIATGLQRFGFLAGETPGKALAGLAIVAGVLILLDR